MVAVHGGDPSSEQLTREIFGYVRAAVPGAAAARAGFVHSAAGGSLLLEGVPAFDFDLLDEVVRAAASGRARMLGAGEGQPFDLRLMLTSDLDAAAMVQSAEPWASLPARLGWLWIAVPPLRARSVDLPLLMAELLAAASVEQGRPAPELSAEAAEVVAGYGWPGNLVEMCTVARALVAGSRRAVVERGQLPPTVRGATSGDSRTLAEVEADHVRAVVKRCEGNRSEAARRLGIDRKTLRAKLARTEVSGDR